MLDGESSLNWTTFHDHLLDGLFALSLLHGTLKGVLLVIAGGGRVTLLGALWRGFREAAWLAFGWVRVRTLWAVVVAMWEGEVLAHALAERSRALVLPTLNGTFPLDVSPWGGDLTSTAAVRVGAEANILSREWKLHGTLGGNAHTVRGGFGTTERPAAATVGLITNISNNLGAHWPVGL